MTYFVTFNDGKLATRLIQGVHTIPNDAVEVDAETWSRITQETDGIWTLGADGSIAKKAIEVDPLEQASRATEAERIWRNGELVRVSWVRDRHRDEIDLGKATTLDNDQFAELLTYMQDLRDWPESQSFPDTSGRPVPPAWIADQSQ